MLSASIGYGVLKAEVTRLTVYKVASRGRPGCFAQDHWRVQLDQLRLSSTHHTSTDKLTNSGFSVSVN